MQLCKGHYEKIVHSSLNKIFENNLPIKAFINLNIILYSFILVLNTNTFFLILYFFM